MLKRTALFEEHQKLGGRLIDFGGWELPVQYSGVMDEHLACRAAAGLFDVSHMGEVLVEGNDAESYLNFLVTNNVAKLSVGQAQYTAMCHSHGGIVDDLVIYRRAQNRFLVVVNASNTEKDFQHMVQIRNQFQNKWTDLQITNESSKYTQIAIQGRQAASILSQITQTDLKPIKTYWFSEGMVCQNIPAILARTGYTGEDGFEIYVPWDSGPKVWQSLLSAGGSFGLKPCGLGARDTLRLEMKYPLYGNELTDETHPLEAGLGWVTKLDKGEFVGRDPIARIKEKGLQRQLVSFKMIGRGIPRHGYSLLSADGQTVIGEVTSGTQSPSLKYAIGIGYVLSSCSQLGSEIQVDIRGTQVSAQIVPSPFYKRPY